MPVRKKRTPIPGSDRKPVAGAQDIGPTDPFSRAEVTLRLRPRKSAATVLRAALKMAEKLPRDRKYLTREEFAEKCGADPADLKAIDDFSRAHNLTVVDTNIAGRTVRLNGAVGDLNAAFGVQLKQFQVADITYRGRTGKITLPESVSGIIEGVYGLDNRRIAEPHYRVLDIAGPVTEGDGSFSLGDGAAPTAPAAGPKNAPDGSFKVPDLSKLYSFPAGLDGRGQCIALIELNDTDSAGHPTGTGYAPSDLNTYFQSIGVQTPSVVAIGVDGGANIPGPDPGTDGEVALDIEVAGALAPGAQIAVYFGPNTTAGFIDAVNAALHDTVRKPSVISISWGGPEDGSPQQFLDGMNQAFSDAATLGVTVCTASGDNGSADEDPKTWDKKPHVDFPSSIPFALACGGTKLLGSGTQINSEVVWNEGNKGGATGGGVSNIFPRPSYQAKAKVPVSPKKKTGRGVPDVAADADPFTGYQVFVGGKASVFGGTSAVAPLWAGLIALMNQRLAAKKIKTVGFLNPLLYGQLATAGALNDITSGNNDIFGSLKGLYKAGPGWDACTGLGSPNGAKLLKALGG
jgi:kumamolisin